MKKKNEPDERANKKEYTSTNEQFNDNAYR